MRRAILRWLLCIPTAACALNGVAALIAGAWGPALFSLVTAGALGFTFLHARAEWFDNAVTMGFMIAPWAAIAAAPHAANSDAWFDGSQAPAYADSLGTGIIALTGATFVVAIIASFLFRPKPRPVTPDVTRIITTLLVAGAVVCGIVAMLRGSQSATVWWVLLIGAANVGLAVDAAEQPKFLHATPAVLGLDLFVAIAGAWSATPLSSETSAPPPAWWGAVGDLLYVVAPLFLVAFVAILANFEFSAKSSTSHAGEADATEE